MPYQLFPTTPFTRADADFDVEYRSPRSAQLTDGSVIVVSTQIYWDDEAGERVRNLVAHRYESDGTFAGAEVLQENAHGSHAQVDIAALADGGFAVTYRLDGSDVMRLRSYDEDGALRGEHVVTAPPRQFTAGGLDRSEATNTSDGALIGLDDGGIAFTFRGWHAGMLAQYQGASTNFTQVFDENAEPVSGPIQIAQWVTNLSFQAHVPDTIRVEDSVPLADGGYAVILRAGSNTPGGDEDQNLLVAMRLFNADGTPRGEAFSVATPDNHDGRVPDAAVLADGSFVIAWTQDVRGEDNPAFWRRYDAEGEPMGEAVQVAPGEANFAGSSSFTMATITPTEDGGFLIIGRDGSHRVVQRYDAEGEPVGGLDRSFHVGATDHFSSFDNADAPRVFDMGEDGYLGFFNTRFWNREGEETVSMEPAFSYRMYAPDIFGTDGDDVLEADDRGTALFGFAGDDTLIGGDGNDFFVPGPGDDVIMGGGGTNLARFGGQERDYEIARGPENTLIVTDTREGSPDGTNTLSDISLLQFAPRFALGVQTVAVADLDLDAMLTGTVKDTGGEAMEGVAVTFSAEGWPDQTVSTDAEGGFTMTLAKGLAGRLDAAQAYDPASDGPISAGDALEALRIAVGLEPSFGPAQAQHFIAADFNGDGQVTAGDALDILRVAVGLQAEYAPRWVFLDAGTDWDSVVQDGQIDYQPGVALDALSGTADMALTGILIGNLAEVV